MARLLVDILEERISQVKSEILEISKQKLTIENDLIDEFFEPQGETFERIKVKNDIEKFTNFTEFELVSLYRQLVSFIHVNR